VLSPDALPTEGNSPLRLDRFGLFGHDLPVPGPDDLATGAFNFTRRSEPRARLHEQAVDWLSITLGLAAIISRPAQLLAARRRRRYFTERKVNGESHQA
jgi:hypothetical protein